ncbi:hypothetical protein LCGC14_0678220 [marine sediment metagenome]|uniref:DUF4332 domain-containing protein n=1 Tax=marine sediment metagenome TaxID=412755 RepID=A0A0F9TAF2_9ZZZZ
MKLTEIIGLDENQANKLKKEGISTTKDLLELTIYKIKKLAKKTGISAKLIDTWQEHADLMRITGINPEYANALNIIGIDSVKELARRNPKNTHTAIVKLDKEQPELIQKVPTLTIVEGWISKAKDIQGDGKDDSKDKSKDNSKDGEGKIKKKKIISGSKVKVWKQDPTVLPIGVRGSYICTAIQDGPKDDKIDIIGMPITKSNKNNDFLFDFNKEPKKFDAVHTFTVIRQVITMYERALLRQDENYQGFQWQWGDEPIKAFPHAGQDANAYYSRDEKALKFFYFNPDNDESKPLVYTCRSFDIVAHETGHAMLDALCPNWLISWHPQTGGLHEAFGDLTSIFTMLAQMDVCEAIIAESKADLHEKTFFPIMGEQFGEAIFGKPVGLRNADNDLKMSEVSTEVHEISQVFTGAIYDILADMFETHLDLKRYDPAETLFRVGYRMALLVINAYILNNKANATYADVAQSMVKLEKVKEFKDSIIEEFTKREILGAKLAALDIKTKYSYKGCCGTFQSKEFKEYLIKAKK